MVFASTTVAQLAQRLGAAFEGDGARELRGVATLALAGPDDLTWVGSDKYLAQLATTRAGAALVPLACDAPAAVTIIRVPDPDLAFCEVLRWLAPPLPQVPTGVHPSAVVEAGAMLEGVSVGPFAFVGQRASIGAGTQLHAHVYVGEETRIGRDCVLWPGVVVRERVTLGDRVVIHPNCTIGADGFGYLDRGGRRLKIPQVGTVRIEDDVEIGANSAVDRARHGVTRIGRGTKVDNLVQIGHNCDIGEDCIIIAQAGVGGSTTIGSRAMIGGQVGIADHARIGDGAIVAGQSGVVNVVPAGARVQGMPAVANREFWRQVALVRRLPDWVERVRELLQRVERIESSADHSARG